MKAASYVWHFAGYKMPKTLDQLKRSSLKYALQNMGSNLPGKNVRLKEIFYET